jgi:hypothetical protein
MTSQRRRAAAVGVVLAVLLLHALITRQLAQSLIGAGSVPLPPPQRIEVAFVRELAPAAPPVVVAPAPPPPRRPARQAAPRPAEPASAPEAAVAEAPAETAAPEPEASAPVADRVAEMAAASAPERAASEPAAGFEWPPSTRLTYTLTGNYRGEVHGSAQVQWVRSGPRYQVHVDVAVGPSFAPLVQRRMTSDGELTEHGLAPQRYDEETTALFSTPRRSVVRFEPERIVMAHGASALPWPGVQDSASQFVQLTWLFTTQPDLLRVGNHIEFGLALPRRVGRWVYDVLDEETLYTPIGEIATFHVKPRVESTRPGELSAELWFAPSLQYLPVRIRIRQNDETYIDLLIDGRPLQAERG